MKCNYYNLKELATIKYGKNQKNVISETGDFPIFGTGGLMGYATKYLYDKPTVMIGRKGTINKVRYYDKPFWTVDTLFYTEINEDIISPKFFYYLLSRVDFNQYNEGTTIPSLRTETLNRLEFEVPSLKVQNKIIKLLEPIENKIKLNEVINNNLEQQAMAIFKSWFIDYEPFPDNISIKWKVGTIKDLSKEIICGKTPSTKKAEYYGSDVPFITIPDMHNKIFSIKTTRSLSIEGAASQIKKMLPKNAICVSCIGTAGLVTITSEKSQTNQQINAIIPKDNISPYFIFLLMKTLSNKINKLGQGGSTIVNLNKEQFSKIEINIPDDISMNYFHKIISPLFNDIFNNQKENLLLSALKNNILPKLLSGELDVSNIDI